MAEWQNCMVAGARNGRMAEWQGPGAQLMVCMEGLWDILEY